MRRAGTYERTRASLVRPAMAIPTWSSIRMSFFWYVASSPVDRYLSVIGAFTGYRFEGSFKSAIVSQLRTAVDMPLSPRPRCRCSMAPFPMVHLSCSVTIKHTGATAQPLAPPV